MSFRDFQCIPLYFHVFRCITLWQFNHPVLYTHPLNTKDDLDQDIVKQMASLGCFQSFEHVSQNLLDKRFVGLLSY